MGSRDSLIRVLLRLFPREFRERFGDDMAAAYRETHGHDFWRGFTIDALLRAPGEHMRITWHDIRYAARALRRTPMFTLVAIGTLALGIGANTAIFSVVHAVALQPLRYRDADRLVKVWEKNDKLNTGEFAVSVPNFYSWRERARSFEDLGAWRNGGTTLTTGGDPERMVSIEATANVLAILGVQPIAGRRFSAEEDRPGVSRVVMLAESVWRNRFGARPDSIGQAVLLDGVPHTVVGVVADRDLVFPVDIIVPLAADLARESRSNHMMTVIGRLRPGVTLAQARQEMDAIALQLAKEFPKDDQDWSVSVGTFYDWLVPVPIRSGLYLLLSSVVLVLLIACTNIANLTLARAALRRREQAVRLALGASRGRIVREVMTESVLLSLAGGTAGVALAYWATPVFRTQLATVLPRTTDITLNTPVLLFALGVSAATGLLFGALPALLNSRREAASDLKEGWRGGGARHQSYARRLLVAGQLALAAILLTGAALLVQSFVKLQRVDLGFQPSRITTARVGLASSRYSKSAARWQFYSRLLQAIENAPGVEAAGASSDAPLTGGNTAFAVRAKGANALGTSELQADWRIVSPGYFRAMGIPILRGRTFGSEDRPEVGSVMILSADMARRFWPNEDPVGKTLLDGDYPFRIVGVAGDVRNLGQAIDPHPTMYFSTTQTATLAMHVVVRTRTDVPIVETIRKTVRSIDPELAVFGVRTMDTLLANNAAQSRVTAWLVGSFAMLALLLAAIGVYGVLAYLVTQRTREIGVRIALGAQPGSVLRLVVGQSLALAAAGIAIGIGAAFLLAPQIESQLFGVKARDAATLLEVPLALFAIALLASYIPARRATRVDPLIALRTE